LIQHRRLAVAAGHRDNQRLGPAVEHAIDQQRPVLGQLGDQIRQPSQPPVQAVLLRLTRDDRRGLDHGIAHTAHANHPRNYTAPVEVLAGDGGTRWVECRSNQWRQRLA
jgi:hypothetical protein